MRFVHISDLHLGKRVNEFSMIEDQRYILEQVTDIIIKEHADAVLIAGDIYDKAVAPAEAVVLFDAFLTKLSKLKLPVCIISGNHDSAERLAFGASVFEKENIYIAPVFDGTLKKASFTDEYGEAHVYMLPFIKPSTVKRFFAISLWCSFPFSTIMEGLPHRRARKVMLFMVRTEMIMVIQSKVRMGMIPVSKGIPKSCMGTAAKSAISRARTSSDGSSSPT